MNHSEQQKFDDKQNLLDTYVDDVNGIEKEDDHRSIGWCECPWPLRRIVFCVITLFIVGYLGFVAYAFRGYLSFYWGELTFFLGPEGALSMFIQKPGLKIWAPFIYGLVYILCTILFIPGSPLTLLAGVVWRKSFLIGFAIVSISSTIGATIAMLLGRTVLRKWVLRKTQGYPTFLAIERAVSNTSWLVLLLRLSPIFPFNLLNYALGLTDVPWFHYMIYSWFGMMPGTMLFVYIGWSTAGVLADQDAGSKTATRVNLIVGLVVSVVVVCIVTYIAKRQLNKQLKLNDDREREEDQSHEYA